MAIPTWVWTWMMVLLYAHANAEYGYAHVHGHAQAAKTNVTYDGKAIVIDGQRRLLISASIHYPRSTPQMWPDLIAKAKEGGIDVIETYVFWNVHEPVRGQYNFNGRLNLVRFLKEVQKAGLYVNLRIGPYVCAEWNYGGFPVWLHYLNGVEFRTDSDPFEYEMKRFTTMIVGMMKRENLFYWQGGPIILAQIENEYGNINSAYGEAGKRYIHWAANMAVNLDIGVPWLMCQQDDAPDPIINTCNGFYCDDFTPNSKDKPKMWTENWTGWFQAFGGPQPHRPVEDIAYAVALFFAKQGTFQNYYMYHGGTNFGRTAGGPFITTAYDYDAPIDEYGMIRQPKWGHLKELHAAIKICEEALLYGDTKNISLGPSQQAHIYSVKRNGTCAAFLVNNDDKNDVNVSFLGRSYHLPVWSVSILPDCKSVVFNTARVNTQTSIVEMTPEKLVNSYMAANNPSSNAKVVWTSFQEPMPGLSSSLPNNLQEENYIFSYKGLKDQINTTKDVTDYLWYTTSFEVKDNHQINRSRPMLSIHSMGHAMLLFINDEISGYGHGSSDSAKFQYSVPVKLKYGPNKISVLSSTVGLQNYGSYFEKAGTGIDGPIVIQGLNGGPFDISSYEWRYQIGLEGEYLKVSSIQKQSKNMVWNSSNPMMPVANMPLMWYKTTFDAPKGSDPVAFDLSSMGKGQIWVNGKNLGRYWANNYAPLQRCDQTCNYRGTYNPGKCATNCGQPSQKWYHIPRLWLKPMGNQVTLFEEEGGNPSGISLATRSVTKVCAHVSELHPPLLNSSSSTKLLQLDCGLTKRITMITFASFGNPIGMCGSFQLGKYHHSLSKDVVMKECVGKDKCEVTLEDYGNYTWPDNLVKSLAVEAVCT